MVDIKREEIYNSVKELVKKICPHKLKLIPHLTFPPPQKTTTERKEQIEAAPVEKMEKVPCQDEPMDIDVCASSSAAADQKDVNRSEGEEEGKRKRPMSSRETTPLKQTTIEMVRASPTDNDHDHDYAPIPVRSKHK